MQSAFLFYRSDFLLSHLNYFYIHLSVLETTKWTQFNIVILHHSKIKGCHYFVSKLFCPPD